MRMTTFDIIISVASVVLGTAGILYVMYVTKHAGRDRPRDPERLRRFIENAPYHLLNKEVFAKAVEVMGSEGAAEAWMNEPAIGLDNRKPVDLLCTPDGVAAIKKYLTQIEYGVYN
jgi:putative toxin-antitoxin system antitoxin component (TIGR02293 family)